MIAELEIPQLKKYNFFLDIKIHKHWWEFVKTSYTPNSIFRGHSNYHKHSIPEVVKLSNETTNINTNDKFPDIINFKLWETKSSFNRQYIDCDFISFYQRYNSLIDNIDIYHNQIKRYLDKHWEKINLLQLLQLFQHYGISTPLIDFTRNPDTALYFAYSDLFNFGVMSNVADDCGNRFITIIELKLDELIALKILQNINDEDCDPNFNTLYHYVPKEALSNKNLELQEGEFIYLDSEMSVEEYIWEYLRRYNLKIVENPIIYHIIPYFSLNFHPISKEKEDVFVYLLSKKKLGCYLYEDIKGIERDMKNSNIKFNCIKNIDNCECLKKFNLSKL